MPIISNPAEVQLEHTNILLTNMITDYRPENPAADFVAPKVKVQRPTDKYFSYTKDNFRVYDNSIRGREESKQVNRVGGYTVYDCLPYALHDFIQDRSRRNVDNPINLDYNATKTIKDAQDLAREFRVAAVANNTSLVPFTAKANAWDTPATADPIKDLQSAIIAIYKGTGGKHANRVTMTLDTAIIASQSTAFKDMVKYQNPQATGQVNINTMLEWVRQLGLEPQVASAFGISNQRVFGSDPSIEPIWGSNVVVFYCEPTPSLETRTFMYSLYTLTDQVLKYRMQGQFGDKIEIFEEIAEQLVDPYSGYILSGTHA